ncbi:MAG: Clp1/GlmU family protein [Candidatus Bathyarchaeia archaeon]
MNLTADAGKTLLVDGPASVTLVSGRVEVFGYMLKQTEKVVIRDGKRMPFAVKEKATFELALGENSKVEEVEGDTIPQSWIEASEKLASSKTRPATAVVLGTVDSGKTSFCTYLINRLLSNGQRVAIIDGDIGQSDIGPPCTIAYALPSKPVTDLFNLEADNAYFVGVTSPSKSVEKTISGLVSLKNEVFSIKPDFIIVNTDGWVYGEEAVNYKVKLVEKISPDQIFCIQQDEILTPLSSSLKNFEIVTIDSPPAIKQRSREKRRNLRELGYIKYLKNAKVQSIPISWVKIESGELVDLNKAFVAAKNEKEICSLLGFKPLHTAEFKDKICVVASRGSWVDFEKIRKTEETLGKKVTVTWKGDEEGLLTALYNEARKFLGIGVVREIDYGRKIMKILTPVSSAISTVTTGKVRLDKNLKEIITAQEETKVQLKV